MNKSQTKKAMYSTAADHLRMFADDIEGDGKTEATIEGRKDREREARAMREIADTLDRRAKGRTVRA